MGECFLYGNNGEVIELKKELSDGKTLVANAITAKGVTTATTASFQIMANNIANIKTLPSSLSSYRFPNSTGSFGSGYKLIASKSFSRPIICVTCGNSANSGSYARLVQTFFPLWGYTIYGSSGSFNSLTSFNKTSYYELPFSIGVTLSTGSSTSGDMYISFSSDAKTVYLYMKYYNSSTGSSGSGTYNFKSNINVYY